MPPTGPLGHDRPRKEEALYANIHRDGAAASRLSTQMAASSRTEVPAARSAHGPRSGLQSSSGHTPSLQRTTSATAAAAVRASNSLHNRTAASLATPAVLTRPAAPRNNSTVLTSTAASQARRSSSTSRPQPAVLAGLSTRVVNPVSPVPGRAKAVLGNAGPTSISSSSSSSLARAASLGLSPAVVARTSNPKSALSSTGSSTSALSSALSKAASATALAGKHVGRTAAVDAGYSANTAQTPLKQGLQRSSSGATYSRTSIFDAVAAEHRHAGRQLQTHALSGCVVPTVEPLTYPGTTARPQPRSTVVQTAATTIASAARSPGHGAQQLGAASSNGLCGVGSPTNDGFLDRLHSKNQNIAAAAAGSGVPLSVAQASGSFATATSGGSAGNIKPATSSFSVALERLKALSFNNRGASGSGSLGVEAIMPVSTSSRSSTDGSEGTQQQRSNISRRSSASCGGCQPASSVAGAHVTSVEALIARNREQFAETLPSLAMVIAESGTNPMQGRSYSAVAASGADAGTKGGLGSETSPGSLSSPIVRSSSKVHRQASTGGPTALDTAASLTAAATAGMQGSHYSSASRGQDGAKGLYHPPAGGDVQQRPVYDPARYTAAAAGGGQQLNIAAATPAAETVRRSSSSGGNVASSRGLYPAPIAVAPSVSPFAATQPISPGNSSYSARLSSGGGQVARLSDGLGSSSSLHAVSAAAGTLYTAQQQQQRQASLARLTSQSSVTVEASRQPSFLIGTHPVSEDEGDANMLVPTAIGDAVVSALRSSSGAAVSSGTVTTADVQSRQDFLAGNVASRSSSLLAPAAADSSSAARQGCLVSRQPAQQQQCITQAGHRHLERLKPQQQQQQPLHGRAAVPVVCCYSDSDSDVSEMSSSLEQLHSSSDDSDSDEDVTAAAAARRRLVGQRVMLGSSISVSSTDGRSSSIGSGKELDIICSTGRQVSAAVVAANKGRGLPCGCVGLNNLGNTCFMNSILQCLNCLPDLVLVLLGRQAVQQIQSSAGSGPLTTGLHCTAAVAHGVQWHPKASVGPALGGLLAEMWSVQQQGLSRQRAISPRQFLRAVAAADERWGDGCQQDSQEFLHCLLEQLQSECNCIQGKPQYKELTGKGSEAEQAAEAEAYARSWHDSLVDDLFGGFLQSTVTCSNCHHRSHCFDPFLDLSVPIPNNRQVSVQDCLSEFVAEEVLTGSEQVKCSACKKTCDATKRLQIFAYPKLLVLTLKRFNSCARGGDTGFGSSWFGAFSPVSKNQTPVKIRAEQPLDLAPYSNTTGLKAAAAKGWEQPRYELIAMSEHSGCLGGGHYTAQGRSVVDGQWYHFNDCSVTHDSRPSGSSSSAYVLFYRLVGGHV